MSCNIVSSLLKKAMMKKQPWSQASQTRAFSSKLTDKFDEVLSFHDGIAAVRERNGGGAYHIDLLSKNALYDIRYKRTFGFYTEARRAAVMDHDGAWFHIDRTGYPVYNNRYSWCGNFHAIVSPTTEIGGGPLQFRSPVRDSDNRYFAIDQHGEVKHGPYSYLGDPNSTGQSVAHDLGGNPKIINADGSSWFTATAPANERKYIEACVPHKGIAAVRDDEGWFYITQRGEEVGRGGRYLSAEPHYNGQARVRFLNGQWGLVDEAGRVVVNFGESMLSSAVELEKISKRYWESLALKYVLENNVLLEEKREMLPSSTTGAILRRILKDCSVEMGLLSREQPSVELLNRGKLLTASSRAGDDVSCVTEARCRYWTQDRYLKAWLDVPQETPNRDTFAKLASDPVLVKQSQNVLKSYADADWKGAAPMLSKLLGDDAERIHTIVDMGGGHGSLLREFQGSGLLKNSREFVCIDRPEVVAAAACPLSASLSASSDLDLQQHQISNSGSIKHEVGDLFEGRLRPADLYLMSRVLHDWSDPQAAAILKRMHSLSPKDARLVVIDRVSTPEKLHSFLSLHMFVLQGSYERSHEQWQELFSSCGWQVDGCEYFNEHAMYKLTKTLTRMPETATAADTYNSSAGSSSHICDEASPLAAAKARETGVAVPTVRKAVITAGGLGSRMAPQSIVTPKALLPVISYRNDSVGLQPPRWEVRPALAYILDLLHDSSHTVDQVFVVATLQQTPLFESFLKHYQQQHTRGKELTIQVVTQQSMGGFGDAILAAREFIGNEPFMLVVGDHVFSASCVKDMLAAYKELGVSSDWRSTALTGVGLCKESEVHNTGLLCNHNREYPLGKPWLVDKMMEKPRLKSQYEMFELPATKKYPSQLGIDILPPSIFSLLHVEKERVSPNQEVDLRKVLRESLQSNGRLFGCRIDGHRLDIGTPQAYFSALQAIHDDSRTYLPLKKSAVQVQELQEQDEILQSVRALQLENSAHMPAILRHILFGDPKEIHIGSSPGRMDLMGGIADYSGSNCIQHPTAERVVTLTIFEDKTNSRSVDRDEGEQGMIRLASIQVDKLSEMSKAVATGDFSVREATFPTRELFAADGQLKTDAELRATLSERFVLADASDRWIHYLTGIFHRICQRHFTANELPAGAELTAVTISDLPWNTGLASSAAVEVASAISFGRALHVPADMLDPVSLSMLCKDVENNIVGGQCGILDQLAVTHQGARTIDQSLVGVQCRMPLAESPTYSLPMPKGMSVIAVESGVKRSTVGKLSHDQLPGANPRHHTYQDVRTGSIVGKAILEASYGKEIQHLCDLAPSQLYESKLPETMTGREIHTRFPNLLCQDSTISTKDSSTTYPVRAATRFPIEENLRVKIFESLLRGLPAMPRESSLQLLGELMRQSHNGYSKCGLGTDATTFLVDAMHTAGSDTVGAKISGGGGGGAVVALVNDSFLQSSTPFDQLQERYYANTGLICTLRNGTSGAAKYHGALRRQFSTNRNRSQDHHSLSTNKPRVLVVNHGYPPDFNGGSEVYAQAVALQLKNSGECESVHVFAREHDPYRGDFQIRRTVDQLNSELPVFRMNFPREAPYFRFIAEEVDRAFEEVVEEVSPDIVHFHHMNHLSLNLPAVAKASGARVLYTLHDFWLMCPRGQFLQTGAARSDPWKLCDGQEHGKCAKHCYASRYASGVYDTNPEGDDDAEKEQLYWTEWIRSRMEATRKACEHIDAFVAPSQHLYNKFVHEFSLPAHKVIVEPYGFFRDRLVNRQRRYESSTASSINEGPSTPIASTQNIEPYVFAYIGRHQPAKGINLLVEAALKLLQDNKSSDSSSGSIGDAPFRVKIFGREDANSSRSLKRLIAEHPEADNVFSWEAEYTNKDIVEKVFNVVDCIVVPSIWEENSPLVIHEAQQCKVPVITPSVGGTGELVKNAVNGLTFEHRSSDSLSDTMRKALEQPAGMSHLGKRGYLYSPDGQIPCIEQHVDTLLRLFQTMRTADSEEEIATAASKSLYTAASTKENAHSIPATGDSHSIEHLPAPWRITFDTNPDDCNFSCIMCEQHSEFSPHQIERKDRGERKHRMDFEIIRKTVADLAPKGLREIIPTTMGEPLYYKHFPKMLKLCDEHGVKLNLTTNGSFYGRGVEKWAEVIIPVGSDVKISWNGITQATQEKITKGSNLDKQIENLKAFVKVRNRIAESGGNYCSVTLQLTFMRANLEEIPRLVKFAINEDCDRVKGHHLWVHVPEMKNENLRGSPETIRRWNVIASECREIAATCNRPSGKPFRLENFNDLDDSQESQGAVALDAVCPFLGQEAWVNHSGRFDPCCAPDLERLKLGKFGNITDAETTLLDIWNSDQYNDLVQSYRQRPLCRNCTMRRPLEKKMN